MGARTSWCDGLRAGRITNAVCKIISKNSRKLFQLCYILHIRNLTKKGNMKKLLKRSLKETYYFENGQKILGAHSNVSGDLSNVTGNLTNVSGNLSGVWGDLSNVRGNLFCVSGDLSNVRGDLSNVRGNLFRVTGDLSGVWGDLSNVRGDLSNVRGDLTGVRGNVDECDITDKDRENGIDIKDLICE